MLKALDQRDFYKAQIQNLKEQNNQKDSYMKKLTTEKHKLKQNVLKLIWQLNNLEAERLREGTLKLNMSNAMKKCSAKFSDLPILNDDYKFTFWVWNNQMKSKLRINDD